MSVSPHPYRWLELEWCPQSAFGSPFLGTQCFGLLCAQLATVDTPGLRRLLEGYLAGHPFLVVGDPRPRDHLPRPTWPLHRFNPVAGLQPKQTKALHWVPWTPTLHTLPLRDWLQASVSDAEVARAHGHEVAPDWRACVEHTRTVRAAQGGLQAVTEWHHRPELRWVIDLVHDPRRLSTETLLAWFEALGARGYGAGASRGLGKFTLVAHRELTPPAPAGRDVRLALGACVPWSDAVDDTWYRSVVYQGRRGAPTQGFIDWHQLIKAPVQLARGGAVVAQPHVPPGCGRSPWWMGLGIGGHGLLSPVDHEGVMQGYAPSWPVRLD
jgi:CRISPR-associated protein Csm4